MITTYAQWLVRWRYPVIFVVLASVAAAALGTRLLEFRTDYRMFFSEDNPQLQAFDHLQNTYSRSDNVLFVVAPKSGEVFTRETLTAIQELTNRAWQIPYSSRVDSITNFQYSHAVADALVVEDLIEDAATLTPAELKGKRAIALEEPLLLNRLISPTGHVTGVNVTVQLPGVDKGAEVPTIAQSARQLANEIGTAHPNLGIYLTGSIMMDNAFPEASQRDGSTLVPLMLVVIIVSVGIFLRAITATVVTVTVVMLSIAAAMGCAGWLGIDLSPTAVAAPNIILTLAVADCVHLLSACFDHMRRGMDKRAALIESLRSNARPVFLTSLTTAIGFLSLNSSDSPPFRDLGNITAIGVLAAYLLSITLLPALVMVMPVRIRGQRKRPHSWVAGLAEFVIRRRNPVLWVTTAVVLGLIAFIPKNELNDEFVKYFGESTDFRQATDFTTDNLTGIYYLDYSLGSGVSGGINDPNFLHKVEEFADWYRSQPEVLHVYAITDILKRLNRNMHGDDPGHYRLPDTRELSAQYLLMYEMSLPYGLDLNDRIDVDKSSLRMTVTLRSLSSKAVLGLEERAQAWLQHNAPAAMQADGASPTVMFAHIGQRNITAMLQGVVIGLVLISLVLMVAFGSLKIGLVSLVPNLIPAAMAFGLWGLTVGQVGLALSVVAAMTLGIVVDDTVHFLDKYLRARRVLGKSPEDAVRYAFASAGPAMWVTTVVLMAGFSMLAFSSFEINAGMGLLTAIALGMALAADFFLLPTLLLTLKETKDETNAVSIPVVHPDSV